MATFWYQKADAHRMPNLRDDPFGQYVNVVRESYVGRALNCLRTPRLYGEMDGLASSPMSVGSVLEEIMVREGGAREASTAAGTVTKVCMGGWAKKPCVTIAIKAKPEATLVWKKWCKDLCCVDLPSSVCSEVPVVVVAEPLRWLPALGLGAGDRALGEKPEVIC